MDAGALFRLSTNARQVFGQLTERTRYLAQRRDRLLNGTAQRHHKIHDYRPAGGQRFWPRLRHSPLFAGEMADRQSL